MEYHFIITNGQEPRIRKYGRLLRYRWSVHFAASPADGNYVYFFIAGNDSPAMPSYKVFEYKRYAVAGAAYMTDISFNGSRDCNIEIKAEDICSFIQTVSSTLYLWLDIIDSRYSKVQQFYDRMTTKNDR